jgi:hypothetical protein
MKTLFSVLLLLIVLFPRDSKDYIDINYPDDEPKPFAEAIISKYYSYVQSMAVSADKKEYYFQLTNPNWDYDKILCLRILSEGRYEIDTVVDSKTANLFKYCGEPCLTRDGKELYFSTNVDIWKLKRENGVWSHPIKLDAPVNTDWNEGHPSISDKGTLFFHSFEKDAYKNSIYYSELKNDTYKSRTKIDILSAEGDAGDPAIAPDESFMVFASSRKSGVGQCDLYISFKIKNEWTAPKNLGPKINTPDWELGPMITADGKYLFFYRRDTWSNAKYSNIYWVSTKVIDELKKEVFKTTVAK